MGRRQIDADELSTLYALIGKAIWHLQHVEDALHTSITIKRDIKTRGAKPAAEAQAILEQHRRNTLGKSLRMAREAAIFENALQERLDRFKEERDWLVHRSLHQSGDDLYEDEKRLSVMRRVELFSDEALALQKAVATDLETHVVAQGVSKEWVESYAAEQLKRLRGA